MRSMTGYGRGQSAFEGIQFTVELNSVNRKQSDIVVNLPRDLAELEPRVRETVNARVARGRINVTVTHHKAEHVAPGIALDLRLARAYHDAMLALQKELKLGGEITIDAVLRAPGVLRAPEDTIPAEPCWPAVNEALVAALADLIRMREREGKHLAKDLIHRLKTIRQNLKRVRALAPGVVKKFRKSLLERIEGAGTELPIDEERLAREMLFYADKSDVTEELTRLESHLAQFAHHLRRNEPVGRPLDFLAQEIYRELNTLGAKASDVEISQLVVACKSELEKIREQVQNVE